MWARVLRGAVACAAETTALNAVTYLDMAVRGRGTSSTPERTVETMSQLVGVPVPGGDRETRSNRTTGIGAVLGIATSGLLVGSAALLGANGPMVVLGITDPREWTPVDWISDLLPHLAYGLVAAFTYRASVR